MRTTLILSAAVAAALVLLAPAQGAFPGTNGLIAYECNTTSICKVNPDGSGQGTLITSARQPAWSPGGTKIAYQSTSDLDIYTANADGSNPVDFVAGSEPAWANASTIVFIDTDGRLATKSSTTTQELITTGSQTDPAVSPNGATIAFAALDTNSDYQLYTIPIGGGATPTQITTGTGDHLAPSWSPDGTLIVFQEDQGIGRVSSTGTGQTHLIADTTAADPAYSPAGDKIVYGTSAGALDTADASTGGSSTPIVSSFANAAAPDWGSAALSSSGGTPPPSDTSGGPTNTSYPVITLTSGDSTPVVGHSLFASTGTWSGTFPISYTYQWKRCDPNDTVNGQCIDISGATSSSYTPTAADYKQRLRVAISATNRDGRHTQNSEVSAVVAAIVPRSTATPPLSSFRAVVDTAITLGAGAWAGSTPLTFTYSWGRCNPAGDVPSCVPISGATSSSYIPTVGDIGITLRAWVTATNIAGTSTVITNHTFPVVDKQHFAPSATTQPAVAGTALPGRQLTGNLGTYAGDAPLTSVLHWYRCDAIGEACHAIPQATDVVYFPTANDVGYTIRLFVFSTNAYGNLLSMSDPTAAIAATPPNLKGRHIVGTKRGDYLAGGGHDDWIEGLGGNDTMLGGAGDDRLYGGGGNDVITGGSGADKVYGGAGSDSIDVVDGERDSVDCGDGNDHVVADDVDVVAKNCEAVVTKPST